MDDIKLKLLDLMRTDPTLQAYLGGSVTDPRVYMYYQGDALIDSQHPAYITFSNISTGEAASAVEEPVFSVVVWSRTWSRCEEIRDRLRALFHKKIFVTTPDSRRIYTKFVGEQDSYQDQPKYAGKTIRLRAGWSTV
jgi:hypothetical protein